ncbi:MAG: dihydropteroate synthase [Alphaproteobacteria bacterium]|nr:dihydropteroate synthase [Alphaproteobacteria bacterium]
MQLRELLARKDGPLVMGIINVTPDSFSGDGVKTDTAALLAQARAMVADGADILDIGGESSRPGATPVPSEQEIARTAPAIAAIRRATDIPISIDTAKAAVAEAAMQAGANIINDITALQGDKAMGDVAVRHNAPVVLMHNRARLFAGKLAGDDKRGAAHTAPDYEDFLDDMLRDLKKLVQGAKGTGVPENQIAIDPGIGFGKTVEQNLMLINHCDRIAALGYPVLIGASRKSFIGHTLDAEQGDRLEGDAAVCAIAVARGASILRVHDVKQMARVVKMAAAITAA